MSESPNKMKHTPGPWKAAGASVLAPSGQVAQAFGTTLGESEPNARLIAAAPSLLEALHAAIPYLDDASPRTLRRIHDAITKAEGVDHV